MTSQESFKRRIRARMAKTGERYGAARRALLPRPPQTASRRWVATPVQSDDRVRAETGRGWDEWTDLVLSGPGPDAGHTAIATWLRDEHGVDPWWAQGVTVGVERILGLRLPGQMPDGTFTASRSRTIDIDAGELRAALEEEESRDAILPGLQTVRRSRAGAKVPKYGLSDDGEALGVLSIAVDAAGKRTRVVVTHEKLLDAEAVERWKAFWELWLDDLAAAVADG